MSLDTPAVATCSSCGAATCGPHTLESATTQTVTTMGNPTARTVRTLTCTSCAPREATSTIHRASGRAHAGLHEHVTVARTH
ncbi:hypothetical protein [Cellulosimicrobium cellulans]